MPYLVDRQAIAGRGQLTGDAGIGIAFELIDLLLGDHATAGIVGQQYPQLFECLAQRGDRKGLRFKILSGARRYHP